MELHEGISQLLEMYGRDYILSSKIVNALIDLNAFEKHRALKNLFKTIHSEGYIERIYNENEWNLKCEQIVLEIEQDYAFPKALIEYALKNVAVSLSFIVNEEIPSESSKEQIEDLDSESNQNDLNLVHLCDNVYLRKDWYEDSPIELQDISVKQTNKSEICWVDPSFSESPVYEIKFDILPKKEVIEEIIRFSILALGNDGRIIFYQRLVNFMNQGSYRTSADFNIKKSTFIPFKTQFSYKYNSNQDVVTIDKFLLSIETGFENLCRVTECLDLENRSRHGLYIKDVFDITCLCEFKDSLDLIISRKSIFGVIGANSIFIYFEMNEKLPNRYRSYFNKYEMLIYNKLGHLKQKYQPSYSETRIFDPGKDSNYHHFCIATNVITLINSEEIGKIVFKISK